MTCPLCRSEKHTPFEETTSFGYPVRYVQCTDCGLVHQSGANTQAADTSFYEETYRKLYQSDERPIAKDLKIQQMRANHLIEMLQMRFQPAVHRALDIGASAGVLLDTYQERLACATIGVEPGVAYREFAAEKGHTMFSSLEDLLTQQPAPFQLVSLMHVTEHLEDPTAMLRQVSEHLMVPDGLLVIEVPNFYAHDSYELAHLACYTPHTLHQLLAQAGFRVLSMQTHGHPRSKLLGLYLLAVATPIKGPAPRLLKTEKNVKLKRTIAMLWRKVLQKVFPRRSWLPLPQ